MDIRVNISGNANFFVPVLSGSPDEARRLLRYYEKELEGRKTDEAAALLDFLQDFLEECQEEQDKGKNKEEAGRQMDEDVKGETMKIKFEKIGTGLEKARKKRAEWDSKVKDLEWRYREEENTEIHEMVHAANLTPEQLAELIRKSATFMLQAVVEEAKKDGQYDE